LGDMAHQARAIGEGDLSGEILPKSADDQLGIALLSMTTSLRAAKEKNQLHNWLVQGQAELAETMRGENGVGDLADKIVSFIATYLRMQAGALYILSESGSSSWPALTPSASATRSRPSSCRARASRARRPAPAGACT
ncbi:MAG: hypothetical protein HQL31_14440, partial [Planctomycetes bacterium]|nr:hypothetical protein [Planctomycetota bacterium]